MGVWCVVLLLVLILDSLGECLKCFDCDSKDNPACGVNFKSYQYKTIECGEYRVKCAIQRQAPQGNFVGIIRGCYVLGSLIGHGLYNETDGCHLHKLRGSNKFLEFCFCSEDYCNNTPPRCCIEHYLIAICAMFGYLFHIR